MSLKIIRIETRPPNTKEERNLFGWTLVEGNEAQVYINPRKNKDRRELLDTLLHELYHAAVRLYGFKRRHEERHAGFVGRVARQDGRVIKAVDHFLRKRRKEG